MAATLRRKLIMTMVGAQLMAACGTIMVVALMNYYSSSKMLEGVQKLIREGTRQKGISLLANQALGLRDPVADNAFQDVSRVVERTVEGDQDLLYGLFVDQEQRAWAFVQSHRAGKLLDDWHQLGVKTEKAASGRTVTMMEKLVAGRSVFEFSTQVVDDQEQVLGWLCYGLSDARLRRAHEEARAGSRRLLVTTVGLLVLVVLATTVFAAVRAAKVAEEVVKQTMDVAAPASRGPQGT